MRYIEVPPVCLTGGTSEFADGTLTSTCTVSKLTKRNEKNGIVELTFEVYNQNNELVLTDVTEMIEMCKPMM